MIFHTDICFLPLICCQVAMHNLSFTFLLFILLCFVWHCLHMWLVRGSGMYVGHLLWSATGHSRWILVLPSNPPYLCRRKVATLSIILPVGQVGQSVFRCRLQSSISHPIFFGGKIGNGFLQCGFCLWLPQIGHLWCCLSPFLVCLGVDLHSAGYVVEGWETPLCEIRCYPKDLGWPDLPQLCGSLAISMKFDWHTKMGSVGAKVFCREHALACPGPPFLGYVAFLKLSPRPQFPWNGVWMLPWESRLLHPECSFGAHLPVLYTWCCQISVNWW